MIPGGNGATIFVQTINVMGGAIHFGSVVHWPEVEPPALPKGEQPKGDVPKAMRQLPVFDGGDLQRLSLDEVAACAGVSRRKVEDWIASKRLTSVKSGRRRLIERRDLELFLEREKRATLRNGR